MYCDAIRKLLEFTFSFSGATSLQLMCGLSLDNRLINSISQSIYHSCHVSTCGHFHNEVADSAHAITLNPTLGS